MTIIYINMSVESFKVLCQQIETQLLKLLNHVTCSICQELFHKPVKTPCGHSFCNRCIEKVLSSKNNSSCPLCKCLIKGYCLEDDKAKFTLSEICRELPNAFQNDVKDGCRFFKYSENDLLSESNIVQLLFEATPKEIITKKQKTFFVDFCKENSLESIELEQSDAKNFVPNLKESLSSKKYEIAIKKKTGDFTSQSEVDPNVDIHPSSQCQTKLQNLKENCTNEKIQKHLNTTVNNFYPENLLSPPVNYSQTKNGDDFNRKISINADNKTKEVKVENPISMLRLDKKKSTNPTILNVNLKNNIKKICNSYKFVPIHSDLVKNSNYLKEEKIESRLHRAQNLAKKKIIIQKSAVKHSGNTEKKKKKRYVNYKAGLDLPAKINAGPDKSEMTFTKTKVKCSIHLKKGNIPSTFSNEIYTQTEENEYHCEVSNEKPSNSNKSGTFKSKRNEIQNLEKKDNIQLHSFFNPPNVTLCKENEFKKEKLKKKVNLKNQMKLDQKESFFNLINLKNEEALHLERSVEKYLLSFKKDNSDIAERTLKINSLKNKLKKKKTTLLSILEELVKDEGFYCKRAKNVSIRFSKNILPSIGHKKIKEKKHKVYKELSIDKLSFQETLSNFSQFFSTNEFVSSDTQEDQLIQKMDLIGFSSTEENTEGTKFLEKIIKNMEMELEFESSLKQNLTENINNFDRTSNSQYSKKPEIFAAKKADLKMLNGGRINKVNEKKKNNNITLGSFQNIPETSKSPYINFLLLGRLTPTTRRSKSSVVKLVFPVGFTSFIKKHGISNKFATGVQTSQTSFQPYKNCIPRHSNSSYSDFTSQVHAAIQTSTNVPSAIFQIPEIKEISSEQFLQDVNQSESIGKVPKQLLNTYYLEKNKFSFERSQVKTPELNKTGENYLEDFSENNFKPETKNVQKNFQNSPSPSEQVKVLCKTLSNSADFENEISLMSDKKLTEQNILQKKEQKLPIYNFTHLPICSNKFSKLPKCDLLNKETTTIPFFKEMKCDGQFSLVNLQSNHTNFMENKSKKIEEYNTKYDKFFTQSSKSFLNYQKKSWINSSPEKYEYTQRAVYPEVFKTRDSDTDLPIRKNKKVSIRTHKAIDTNTEKNKRSEGEISKFLKNINLDRMVFPAPNEIKIKTDGEKNVDEKSEESDSDFFVEQTPPSLMYSRLEEAKYSSKNEIRKNLFFRRPIKRKAEAFQEKHNVNTEKDGVSERNKIGNENTSSVEYIERGMKLLIPDENIVNKFENLQGRNKGHHEGLKSEKFQHFSQEEFSEFSNIRSDIDLFQENLNEKLAENKFGKTTDNSVCSKKKICIVASSVKSLHTIKKFATVFKIEFLEKQSKSMTHLIVGLHENEDGEMLPLCTPKLLFALANKKWVVSELWAETCLKLNKIVPEENFETYDPVGGFGCRNARLSQDFLLENCEIYLLGNFETIPKDELADLITDCGGTLISQPEKFSYCSLKIRMIIVDRDSKPADEQHLRGITEPFLELYEKHRSVVLSRDVIIMSIQTYSLTNFFPYLMHVSSTDDLLKMGYPFFLVKPEESNWDNTMSEK